MKNKNILLVGGTGSWAKGLIKELLAQKVNKIRIFARNEYQMVNTMQEYKDSRIEPVIGDIRDEDALRRAVKGCDMIFHLAALKHVPICEAMPFEAIQTNIMGTENIITCAIAERVEKVIYVSTDKAVNANCTYGCTKLLGEKLILSANHGQSETKFMVFRGGNLLGSTGSVLPLFKKQIENEGQVTLTDENMSRFFITVERASKLLAEAACRGAGGEIFIPVMPSVAIKNIARYLLEKNGLPIDNIRMIGMRPGEKLHEQMLAENEIDCVYKLNEELALVSRRDSHGWLANSVIQKTTDYNVHSGENVLNYEQTKEFLSMSNV